MTTQTNKHGNDATPIRLVIHGGAGGIERGRLKAERERAYAQVLAQSLAAGHAVLQGGGSSIDAVIEAIVVMEDSPLFNAGRGAVFSHEGRIELDASIMDGATCMAGAVAGVTTTRNPIRAAHAVMTKSPHVMLIGQGADAFAAEAGLEIVDPSYFHTPLRWNQLQKAIAAERVMLDHDFDPDTAQPVEDAKGKDSEEDEMDEEVENKRGTVGAVALDCRGNLAAGTSTGGLMNKRFGRVGDSPIIGAGTYADNRSVAVSTTGTGEVFICTAAAFNTAAQVRLLRVPPAEAADSALGEIAALGGDGGLIVLDAQGNHAMRFNTSAMFRGTIGADGVPQVAIFS